MFKFHATLEEQILKSASIGIKKSRQVDMQKPTRFPGSSKTKVCIFGPTTKSDYDTMFIDNVVTIKDIVLLEDIRTGIARNRHCMA